MSLATTNGKIVVHRVKDISVATTSSWQSIFCVMWMRQCSGTTQGRRKRASEIMFERSLSIVGYRQVKEVAQPALLFAYRLLKLNYPEIVLVVYYHTVSVQFPGFPCTFPQQVFFKPGPFGAYDREY